MTELPPEIQPEVKTTGKNYFSYLGVFLTSVLLLGVLFIYFFTTAPAGKAYPIIIEVEPGMSVRTIATLAKDAGLVHSEFLLYAILTAFNDPTKIHAGRYSFSEPTNTAYVAQKFARNEVEDALVTITIPEGVTTKKIAEIAQQNLPDFDTETFLALAKDSEGSLFPETYFVPETYTAQDLFVLLRTTFTEQVTPLRTLYASTSPEQADAFIILASIIEREANDETSMKLVSGILHNRLLLGMALQADATIEYVLDTPLNELPPGEHARLLKELDTPYNTYLYPGLPPTAIGNPGLMAIKAAFEPTPSDYLYYLTDAGGNFYYAQTLAEHNQNVAKYLR